MSRAAVVLPAPPHTQAPCLLMCPLTPFPLLPPPPPVPCMQLGQDEDGAVTLLCSAVDRGFLYPEEVAAQVRGGRVGRGLHIDLPLPHALSPCKLPLP